jgi:hypothetical protein
MTQDHTEKFQRKWAMYACTRCGGVITACSEKGSPYIVEMHPKSLEVEEAIPDTYSVNVDSQQSNVDSVSTLIIFLGLPLFSSLVLIFVAANT